MSVTVADLLNLPSLREARVLGGQAGLSKPVTSISVLEYSLANETQEHILSHIEFFGSELVITALSDVRDQVDAQCANIRRLADIGSPGILLYYVGIILKRVDKRLIDTANEVGIALICMPENRPNLRYSEVLSEVMEAIFRDRMDVGHYKADVLEQVSRLPFYQRSIDTVIRILSDRVRASLLITDSGNQLLNSIFWPRTLDMDVEDFLARYSEVPQGQLAGRPVFIRRLALQTPAGARLWAYVLKQDSALEDSDAQQVSETLQIFLNLWSQGETENALPELVQAILQDEPYKMRRIASVFNVDVASIHNMWILSLPPVGAGRREDTAQALVTLVGKELRHSFKTVVTDLYDQSIVVFMDDPADRCTTLELAAAFAETLRQHGYDVMLTVCFNLKTTAQCRQAWLDYRSGLPTARDIWPAEQVFTWQQMGFAQECGRILSLGEDAVNQRTLLLEHLADGGRADLVQTLTVYLLDADSDVARTAELLFLHANTVKYRLARTAEKLCGDIHQMPLYMELYIAVALRRMLATRDLEA